MFFRFVLIIILTSFFPINLSDRETPSLPDELTMPVLKINGCLSEPEEVLSYFSYSIIKDKQINAFSPAQKFHSVKRVVFELNSSSYSQPWNSIFVITQTDFFQVIAPVVLAWVSLGAFNPLDRTITVKAEFCTNFNGNVTESIVKSIAKLYRLNSLSGWKSSVSCFIQRVPDWQDPHYCATDAGQESTYYGPTPSMKTGMILSYLVPLVISLPITMISLCLWEPTHRIRLVHVSLLCSLFYSIQAVRLQNNFFSTHHRNFHVGVEIVVAGGALAIASSLYVLYGYYIQGRYRRAIRTDMQWPDLQLPEIRFTKLRYLKDFIRERLPFLPSILYFISLVCYMGFWNVIGFISTRDHTQSNFPYQMAVIAFVLAYLASRKVLGALIGLSVLASLILYTISFFEPKIVEMVVEFITWGLSFGAIVSFFTGTYRVVQAIRKHFDL